MLDKSTDRASFARAVGDSVHRTTRMSDRAGYADVNRAPQRTAICVLVAAALSVFGAARVAATWGAIGATVDEPLHIAAGTALIARHSYTRDLQTPPLARIAVAAGPHLAGMQYVQGPGLFTEGDAELRTGEGYRRNLELARLGILPFFLAGCVLLYVWARRVGGDVVAAVAVGLFVFTPPVLAHAGLATTDMAATTMFIGAIVAFTWWLERPAGLLRSITFGIAAGLALATKFSLIGFFGATALGMLVVRRMDRTGTPSMPTAVALRGLVVRRLLFVALMAFVVLFAAYGFLITRQFGFPAPLSEFALGLLFLLRHNIDGNASYLLGKAYVGGRWAFFPVVLLVKTPLPLLVLAAGGAGVAFRAWRETRRSQWLDAVIAVSVTLAVAIPSNINLGVRHILPLYPALCLLAGAAIVRSWWRSRLGRTVAVALGVWLVVGTWRAHPDYLSWFNELAASDPGAVLVDSDLDWGQDLERLADTVRARGIHDLSLIYFGNGTRPEHLIPGLHRFHLGDPRPSGWLAVSETLFRRGLSEIIDYKVILHPDALAWLRSYTPVTRIGQGMRLYYIPPPGTDGSDASAAASRKPGADRP